MREDCSRKTENKYTLPWHLNYDFDISHQGASGNNKAQPQGTKAFISRCFFNWLGYSSYTNISSFY